MSAPSKTDKSSNRSINQNLLGFIPALVVDNLLEKIKKKEIRKLPEKQTMNSVVMFADISGFTNLSEKLSQLGAEGAELLAFALTRYMEFLVKAIGLSGGDIFKFAGDAMIVLWPPPQHNTEEELTTLCRQAIQSSLDIQSKLHEIRLVGDIKLSVKIGFGVGQVTILHVGGVFSRAEYLAAGDPLTEAFECEHLATSGGVVIISKKVYQRVQQYFEFTPVVTDGSHGHSDNAPFFYVHKVKKDQKVKMKADALLIKNKMKPSDIESIRQSLISYIPAAVMTFLQADQEKWSHELRRLSVMFCNLGIDLSDAQTEKGLQRIQVVIETVQRCVYFFQGSLNKLLMDDKGSTLMIIFGLHPMAHQDDAVRAVFTGLSLIKELKKINCSCSVGITTGVVFAGVVGTSGSRREFSVLGDTVNLSARFMQAACKEKDKKILVDENTKREAENKISFKFFMFQKVKGKSGDIPFYEPIDFDDVEINKFPYNIRTHISSPQKGITNNESFELFGKKHDEETKKTMSFVEKFIKKNDHNMLILIQGTYGIGKSLFIRCLVEKIYKISDNTNWKYEEETHILVSFLNVSNKSGVLNGWRAILQKLLAIFSMRIKSTPETAIIKILEDSPELLNSLQLMGEILNLKLNRKTEHDSLFKFDEKEHKTMLNISLKILSAFLEENENLKEKNNNKQDIITQQAAPLFIVLDDMQDYDPLSWALIKKVMKKIKRVFIIGAVRTEYCELPPSFAKRSDSPKPKTSEDNKPLENLTLEEIMENGILELEEAIDSNSFYRIELEGFSKEDISLMARKRLNYNQVEFEGGGWIQDSEIIRNKEKSTDSHTNNEENDKTRSKKSKTFIKVKKKSQKDKEVEFSSPVYRILKLMKDKTQGRPLDIIHLSGKLIEGGYLSVNDNKLNIKNKMMKCIEINQYLTIDAPICRTVINGEILDRLDCESYLLMKPAAVIGECFDYLMLLKVNPFKDTIPPEKVRRLINYLEKQEFLEVLDEQEHNTIYRFMHPFMREVIYQRMIYSQRRQIHRFVAEALQSIPLENEANEKLETDNLIYHWSLAENQDVFQTSLSNSTFSNKAKRSVIVKKISSIVSKNPNNLNITLKSGWLQKRSDLGLSWSDRFVVMSCKDLKYYYSEDDFKENTDFALGVISLKHIFNIFQLNERETKKEFAFMIYTGSWQKKNKEMGIREFYFAAKSFTELEQWITYIEFIRAKAIYDDFVYSFGKISFPLNNNIEKIEGFESNVKEAASMSRMTLITQAMESSKIYHKNTSFLSRKNTSRKMTAMKGFKSMNSMALNSLQDVATSNMNQELAKKLKERIQRFINLSLMLFHSHIIESASKYPRPKPQIVLGSTTMVLRKYPFIIEPSLMDDKQIPILNQKLASGALNNSVNTLESFDATEYGGSPKLNRASLVRSVSGNDDFPGDSSFASSLSAKKLEEPPSLNPVKNATYMNNFNKNPLEMIQEEMEDRNSINDLKKFNETNTRFHKKIESIRDSVHLMVDSQGHPLNDDMDSHLRNNSFDLMPSKPSKFLTQADIESIIKVNDRKKSEKEEEEGFEEEKEKEKEKEEEKIDDLSTKSDKFGEFVMNFHKEKNDKINRVKEKDNKPKVLLRNMKKNKEKAIEINEITINTERPGFNERHHSTERISPYSNRSHKIAELLTQSPPMKENTPRKYQAQQVKLEPILQKKLDYQTAFAKNSSRSIDGDTFMIPQGDTVLVTRIYEKKGLGEILYKGLMGLFELKNFEINHENMKKSNISHKTNDLDENIENEGNEGNEVKDSKKIPKVLLRKKMMENRNARSKTPKKDDNFKVYGAKTVVKKRFDDEEETTNWNYGKITFQIKEK